MHKRPDLGRRWSRLAVLAWLLLAAYAGVSWVLVGHYQPKVVLDRDGPAAVRNLGGTVAGNLYEIFAPIWQYNWLVMPTLFALAAGFSVMAWSQVRRSRGVAA
jgi:hypothetical protein